MTDETPEGSWRYAVRETDEDGDTTIWTSWSSYTNEPFRSAQDAADFANGWLRDYEVVRTWVPAEQWEVVPETEKRESAK